MSAIHLAPQLQREFDEHVELWETIFHTQATVGERSAPGYEVRRLLRRLGDMLLMHFDNEESDEGCFGEVLMRDPRLSHRAAALLREHFDLRLQYFAIEQQATRLSEHRNSAWNVLETRLTEFVDRFVVHEAAETELLHSAYCEDLGSGE